MNLEDDFAITPNETRIRWLKSLAKGAGILGEIGSKPPPPEAWVPEDHEWDVRDTRLRIIGAGLDMPKWRATRAVFNALGIEHLWGGPDYDESNVQFASPEVEADYRRSLMSRRKFLADAFGVSMRTVMRHEDVGFILLDDYLNRIEMWDYETRYVRYAMAHARADPQEALGWVHKAERELLERYPELSVEAPPQKSVGKPL